MFKKDTPKRCDIYYKSDKSMFIIIPLYNTTSGYSVASAPVFTLVSNDSDFGIKLSAKVENALTLSEIRISDLSKARDEGLKALKDVGFPSWKDIDKKAKICSILLKGETVSVTPTKNLGTGAGFDFISEKKKEYSMSFFKTHSLQIVFECIAECS